MVLLGQSDRGPARIDRDVAELLDHPSDLDGAIRSGTLKELAQASPRGRLPVSELRWLLPVRPTRVCVVARNYRSHLAELRMEPPARPVVHDVSARAVVDPGTPIRLPPEAPGHVDFEGELVVVMGARAVAIDTSVAWNHVAALTIGNDVTARDVQVHGLPAARPDVVLAKGFDTFKPLGPWLRLCDETARRTAFELRTLIDGEVSQHSSTADLIFDVPSLIAEISSERALEPGDVVFTGTPSGTGHTSGTYLSAGQTVVVQVDGIGALANRVT